MGDERVVQLLLGWGADVNACSEHQCTALQVAARQGAMDAMRMLLDRGTDVNAPPGPDDTASEAALYIEDEEIVRMLHAAGGQTVEVLQTIIRAAYIMNFFLGGGYFISLNGAM